MRFSVFILCSIWASVFYAQSITDSLIIEEDLHILYASDKYDISPEDDERINILIRRYFDPAYHFRLDAHTDTDGSNDYNIKLSRKRCDGIKNILLSKGIPSERIDFYSHGETQLLVEETNNSEKSKNRRATIKVFKSTEFISFTGDLSQENSKEKVSGDIYVNYDNHESTVKTDDRGRYKLQLPTNKKVELNILAKNHFPLRKEILLTPDSKTDKIKFELTEYSIDNSIRTTIQFKGNKSIVLKKSRIELEYLGLSLLNNPDVCVELEGHINRPNEKPVPRGSWNFGLSIARSLEIFNYLEDEGISPERMLAKGYGSSQMLYPKASGPKQESANRRVEVKVITCEQAASIENDSVPDLSKYNHGDPMSKEFYYRSKEKDMATFPKLVKDEINGQIEFLEDHKDNPEKYTYLQLLRMARSKAKK